MKKLIFLLLFCQIYFYTSAVAQLPVFPAIYYERAKFDIPNDSISSLKKIIGIIKDDSTLMIQVFGHTDNKGNKKYNEQLSDKRAEKIAAYFLRNGIKKKQISWEGYGWRQPIGSNETETGKAKNRRVELVIKKRNGISENERATDKILRDYLSGRITDYASQNSIEAEIIITDSMGSEITRTKSNAQNGEYRIQLPVSHHEKILMMIFADKYFFDLLAVSTDTVSNTTQFTDFTLQKMEIKKTYRLKNIYFFGNETRIKSQSNAVLNGLLKMMAENKNLEIQIEGHTNCAGAISGLSDQKFHRELSEGRAYAVYNFLVEKGISEQRLRFIGLGCRDMIFPKAKLVKEMEQNMRVEIRVLDY